MRIVYPVLQVLLRPVALVFGRKVHPMVMAIGCVVIVNVAKPLGVRTDKPVPHRIDADMPSAVVVFVSILQLWAGLLVGVRQSAARMNNRRCGWFVAEQVVHANQVGWNA